MNVIILTVCSFEDVSQGMYDTAGGISVSSAPGFNVYANVLEKLS